MRRKCVLKIMMPLFVCVFVSTWFIGTRVDRKRTRILASSVLERDQATLLPKSIKDTLTKSVDHARPEVGTMDQSNFHTPLEHNAEEQESMNLVTSTSFPHSTESSDYNEQVDSRDNFSQTTRLIPLISGTLGGRRRNSESLKIHPTTDLLRTSAGIRYTVVNNTNGVGQRNFNSVPIKSTPPSSSAAAPALSLTTTTAKPQTTTTQATTTVDPLARPDNCSSCFSNNFTYVHVNKNICSENQTSNIDMVMLITTTHVNRYKREVIRKTWLDISKNNTSNVRYVFLLGSQSNSNISKDTADEFNKYMDIVQEDVIDSYNNLTLKTIIGLKWASLFCSSAKFVMKTDDDMYVNVSNLLKSVKHHQKQLETSVGGSCKHVAYPIRESNSKWYASFRQFPRSEYPGYCSGTGYVTSMAVMQNIFAVSKDVPFFYLEDVYISLCIKRLGYTLTNLEGFNPVCVTLDSCVYKGPHMITSHGLSPKDMMVVFTQDCITHTRTDRD